MNHVNVNPNHMCLQVAFASAESTTCCSHSKATSCEAECGEGEVRAKHWS